MINLSLDDSIIEQNKFKLLFFPLLLSIFICLTNLSNILYEEFYIFIAFLGVIVLPIEYGISVILINVIYFGYSYIIFSNPFLSITKYCNWCLIIITVKYIIIHLKTQNGKIKFELNKLIYIIAFLYFVIRYLYSNPFHVLFVASLLLGAFYTAKRIRSNKTYASLFALQLCVILLTVFLYYFLQMGQYDTAHSSWIGVRFTGVRDPNNFALLANIALTLFHFKTNRIKKSFKILIEIVFIIGVLFTLSVSGLITCIVILLFIIADIKGNNKFYTIGLLFFAILIIIPIIQVFDYNRTSAIGTMANRLSNIMFSLETGDVASATTGRAWLWDYYINIFNSWPFSRQLFGKQNILTELLKDGILSSHNTYIDVLLSYGLIGLIFMLIVASISIIRNHKSKEKAFLLLNILIVVNIFFRSTSSSVLVWTCIFL